MSGVELQLASDGRLDRATVAAALDAAVQRGDTEALFVAAVRADAQRLYEQGRGLREAAREMAVLVVECNAAIGQADLRKSGGLTYRATTSLVIGDVTISKGELTRWRLLGIARERGTLGQRISEAGAEPTTSGVAQVAQRAGDSFTTRAAVEAALAPVIEKWRAEYRKGPRGGFRPGMRTVQRRAGVVLASSGSAKRMTWLLARALLDSCDLDATALPSAPAERRGKGRQRRWVKVRRRLRGGRWDEAYSRFRVFLDEFQTLAPNTGRALRRRLRPSLRH